MSQSGIRHGPELGVVHHRGTIHAMPQGCKMPSCGISCRFMMALGRIRTSARWAFASPTLVAAILPLVLAVVGVGCQNRKVKVEITASGDEASRTFATNDTDKKALAAAIAAYGTEGERDTELGRRFQGTFAESALPSEIGNRGAIGRVDSALGSARVYYEQFADRRGEWEAMRDRVESGILWGRLFGRFIETRKLKDDAAKQEFSTWWNGEVIPLISDAYLMYSGMQAAVQSQRIGAMPRKPEDFGERTADESFRLTVFEPLALLFAERGWLTADELATVQMLAVNGNVSQRERAWASERVFTPVVSRIVARFDPAKKDMKLGDFVPLAIEFVLWTKLSREYRDLVLASPVIPEATKEAIRKGVWDFELPPPFGFRTMERPKVTEAEVLLATGAEPFLTNGVWNAETGRVEFKGGFYEAKYRYIPYNPPYYALWALPSQKQESVFGRVVLEGEQLAIYCAWEAALDDQMRTRWMAALDALASTKDAQRAFACVTEFAQTHPVPRALALWIAERAGQPLPNSYMPASALPSSKAPVPSDAAAKPGAGASTAQERAYESAATVG